MKKILVIDDSPQFAFILSSVMRLHKIEVDTSLSSTEGLSKIKENEYSVVICDYLVDDLNGLQISEQIRIEGINKDIPIMLLTVKDLDEVELNLLNKLKLLYCKKPIKPNELHQKIMELME